jgi:hypothetical protein
MDSALLLQVPGQPLTVMHFVDLGVPFTSLESEVADV